MPETRKRPAAIFQHDEVTAARFGQLFGPSRLRILRGNRGEECHALLHREQSKFVSERTD
jgi:hypothetical protein